MIEAHGLTKKYGDKVAVDNLSFVVRPGMVTGFLGPNGAGKSTTMRMILGLDAPTSGTVTLNGKPFREHTQPLHEAGALLEARAIHTGRSARNHLLAMAATTGISRSRVEEVIGMVGLADVAGKRAGAFSLGMGQRLGIASALLGDPKTLILDEPVNGLDPDGIRWIRNLLKGLADRGHTVFLSSHLMSEMAVTADHVIVVGQGRLLRDQSMAEFIEDASSDTVRVRSPQATELAQALARPGVRIEPDEGGVLLVSGLTSEQIGTAAAEARLTLFELTTQSASLEEAYMALTAASVDYRATSGHPGHHHIDRQGSSVSGSRSSSAPPTLHTGTTAREPDLVRTEPVVLRRVVKSEWIKFRTLRSTLAVLASAAVGMVAIGLIVAYNTRHLTADLQPDDHVQSSTLQGYYLGQLLIGALGVLFVSGEYSTGMIRSTLVSVPRRIPVLWAKLTVFVTATAVTMIVSCIIAFVAAQALIGQYRTGYSLADPGVLRVVVGTGVYLTLIGVIGAALGWIVRSTPGALVAYIAVILVLPVLFGTVLGTWGKDVARFMPSQAGASFVTTIREPNSLSPWTGLAVLALWAAVGIAVAAAELRRRDA